jgi:hypothetical protein
MLYVGLVAYKKVRQCRFTSLKTTPHGTNFVVPRNLSLLFVAIRVVSRASLDVHDWLSVIIISRDDDGHAPPLSLSGKTFSLTFILLSPLVRFLALNRIKPQPPPLVCSPANSGRRSPYSLHLRLPHINSSLVKRAFPKAERGIRFFFDFFSFP